jgi:hypothetical protein
VKFPAQATAGLSFKASVVFADYPAPDWALTVHLRGPAQINLDATADGAGHKLDQLATTTAAWAPGTYWFSMRAAQGDDVQEVATGQLEVLPDLAAVNAPHDGRTQNEIALDAINAVLAKRATRDQERYSIHDRELWRTPIPDLIKLQAFYKAAVQREKNRRSGRTGFGRQVHVRFGQ